MRQRAEGANRETRRERGEHEAVSFTPEKNCAEM